MYRKIFAWIPVLCFILLFFCAFSAGSGEAALLVEKGGVVADSGGEVSRSAETDVTSEAVGSVQTDGSSTADETSGFWKGLFGALNLSWLYETLEQPFHKVFEALGQHPLIAVLIAGFLLLSLPKWGSIFVDWLFDFLRATLGYWICYPLIRWWYHALGRERFWEDYHDRKHSPFSSPFVGEPIRLDAVLYYIPLTFEYFERQKRFSARSKNEKSVKDSSNDLISYFLPKKRLSAGQKPLFPGEKCTLCLADCAQGKTTFLIRLWYEAQIDPRMKKLQYECKFISLRDPNWLNIAQEAIQGEHKKVLLLDGLDENEDAARDYKNFLNNLRSIICHENVRHVVITARRNFFSGHPSIGRVTKILSIQPISEKNAFDYLTRWIRDFQWKHPWLYLFHNEEYQERLALVWQGISENKTPGLDVSSFEGQSFLPSGSPMRLRASASFITGEWNSATGEHSDVEEEHFLYSFKNYESYLEQIISRECEKEEIGEDGEREMWAFARQMALVLYAHWLKTGNRWASWDEIKQLWDDLKKFEKDAPTTISETEIKCNPLIMCSGKNALYSFSSPVLWQFLLTELACRDWKFCAEILYSDALLFDKDETEKSGNQNAASFMESRLCCWKDRIAKKWRQTADEWDDDQFSPIDQEELCRDLKMSLAVAHYAAQRIIPERIGERESASYFDQAEEIFSWILPRAKLLRQSSEPSVRTEGKALYISAWVGKTECLLRTKQYVKSDKELSEIYDDIGNSIKSTQEHQLNLQERGCFPQAVSVYPPSRTNINKVNVLSSEDALLYSRFLCTCVSILRESNLEAAASLYRHIENHSYEGFPPKLRKLRESLDIFYSIIYSLFQEREHRPFLYWNGLLRCYEAAAVCRAGNLSGSIWLETMNNFARADDHPYERFLYRRAESRVLFYQKRADREERGKEKYCGLDELYQKLEENYSYAQFLGDYERTRLACDLGVLACILNNGKPPNHPSISPKATYIQDTWKKWAERVCQNMKFYASSSYEFTFPSFEAEPVNLYEGLILERKLLAKLFNLDYFQKEGEEQEQAIKKELEYLETCFPSGLNSRFQNIVYIARKSKTPEKFLENFEEFLENLYIADRKLLSKWRSIFRDDAAAVYAAAIIFLRLYNCTPRNKKDEENEENMRAKRMEFAKHLICAYLMRIKPENVFPGDAVRWMLLALHNE